MITTMDELDIKNDYIKELEQKVKDCNSYLEQQKRINSRLTNNYEYLDQLYDKVLLLLTKEQTIELNKFIYKSD